MTTNKAPPMSTDEPDEDTETQSHTKQFLALEESTGLELLRHIQRVFEQNLDKDDPWIEVYYRDEFEQVQYMRMWMRPSGHHVSRLKH